MKIATIKVIDGVCNCQPWLCRQPFLDAIVATGAIPVIPPHQRHKQPWDYDTWLYRKRHLVKCFISKLKHYHRIFTRFDKLASHYLGFFQFVSILIWFR